MTSKYEDNHVVEDHMGDLLILIGHFRDELCWKNSITVYSQLFCRLATFATNCVERTLLRYIPSYFADFMFTMARYLTLYVILSLMVLQGK